MHEVETKLAVHAGFTLPDLADLAGPDGTVRVDRRDLRATYLDTDDLRLVRAGITLRHRLEEGVGRWQLKLPVGGSDDATSRTELQVDGTAGHVPVALRRLVIPWARTEPLHRVARLRTMRTATVLTTVEGITAEVADDEVSVHDGNRLAARFRELEVECPDDVLRRTIVDRLLAAGAERTAQESKLARALGPRATRPGDLHVVDAGPPDPDRPVGEIVSRAMLLDLARMAQHEPGTRLGEDAEALHQMRVATRRLRTTLRTYRPVLDPDWADDLRVRLRDLAHALGEVRDLDVRLGRLDAEAVEGPAAVGLTEIRAVVAADRMRARARLLAVLDDPGHVGLLDDLVRAAHGPRCLDPGAPAAPALLPLVATAWRRVAKAVGDRELHDVRTRIKRLRYAAEAVEPAVGKPARRLARRASRAQEVLGAHQDAVVARAAHLALLQERSWSTAAAFTLGLLTQREEERMAQALAAWPAAWAALRQPKLRRFLTA